METLFLKLVNLSLTAGYLVLAVMLVRLVFSPDAQMDRLCFVGSCRAAADLSGTP